MAFKGSNPKAKASHKQCKGLVRNADPMARASHAQPMQPMASHKQSPMQPMASHSSKKPLKKILNKE